MTVEEHARRATPDDLERITALATAGIAELTPTRGGELWARREARPMPVAESLIAAVDDPDQAVFVGELDGVIVGYAAVRCESLRDGSRLAVLDDIYVDPEGRGVGVGELMMDQVVTWATEKGCVGIDSMALPGNRATKNFFESFGLVARAIVVHRPLPTDGDAPG